MERNPMMETQIERLRYFLLRKTANEAHERSFALALVASLQSGAVSMSEAICGLLVAYNDLKPPTRGDEDLASDLARCFLLAVWMREHVGRHICERVLYVAKDGTSPLSYIAKGALQASIAYRRDFIERAEARNRWRAADGLPPVDPVPAGQVNPRLFQQDLAAWGPFITTE
ncbi:hypothetical protein IT570_00695 [Candidatus Sumerlaeota bacterium]|nr:hypothetical protein [Candidatus Sumerlaeota bacterium]